MSSSSLVRSSIVANHRWQVSIGHTLDSEGLAGVEFSQPYYFFEVIQERES